MLTSEQTKELERLQSRALKNIYGYVYSHKKLLEMSGIKTLEERREEACLKFAVKTANNPRFALWFPMRRTGSRRSSELKYAEQHARTDRRMNSPLFYYQRILNNRVSYDVRK